MAMLCAIIRWFRPDARHARRFTPSLLAIVAAIASGSPVAQADHTHAATGSSATFGTVAFDNSCAPAVQTEFRTAIAKLHSFAAQTKDFTEVARKDPSCAIAWWGAAMAARGNPLVGELDRDGLKVGRDLLGRAAMLKATQRERAYIDALLIYYQEYSSGGQMARARAYETAMERVFTAYPDDVEAAAFYGLAMVESVDLNIRNYDQQLKAGKVLEALLASQPDHPGGLHYLIHAYDFAPLAERGLAAARRYAAAAPASYHARHMPAHIFTMLGLWEESIRANRDSNAVIDPARADDPVGGDVAGLHAFDFIAYARLQLAQDRWVAADLEAMRKARRPATLMNARYVLERGDWQAAADFPLVGNGGFDDVTARFARALGSARLGQAKRARAELSSLRALRNNIEQSSGAYWAGLVDIYALAAEGWTAKSEGRPDDGLKQISEAAELEDGREKSIAMENKLLPIRELLGEYLLEIGRPVPAETTFAQSLEHSPNRFRSFLGGARGAVAAGDASKARDYYGKLLKLTLSADSRSQEISEARTYLEK